MIIKKIRVKITTSCHHHFLFNENQLKKIIILENILVIFKGKKIFSSKNQKNIENIISGFLKVGHRKNFELEEEREFLETKSYATSERFREIASKKRAGSRVTFVCYEIYSNLRIYGLLAKTLGFA